MTFKHSPLSSSIVMRSLEKIAIEKGLIKPEIITKIAEKKLDLAPSNNLLENIMKLHAGLEKAGLYKFSKELQEKFIDYKKAENALYDVSKKTGEDIINQAHPEGSHTFKDVAGDSTIETVIDQHLKTLDMINKKPTGKLSKSSEIIKAVKIVLAQDTGLDIQIKKNTERMKELFNIVYGYLAKELEEPDVTKAAFDSLADNPTLDNLDKLKTFVNRILNRAAPTSWGGVSKDTWSIIGGDVKNNGLLIKILSFIEPTKALVNKKNEEIKDRLSGKYIQSPQINQGNPVIDIYNNFNSKANSVLRKINLLPSQVIDRNQVASSEIKEKVKNQLIETAKEVNKYKQDVAAQIKETPDDKDAIIKDYSQAVDNIIQNINKLEEAWK